MTEKHDKLPPGATADSDDAVERRRRGTGGAPPKLDPHRLGGVGHDDQGNAVWQWRVDVRRRDDDPTIDLLECLDVDGLTLDDEAPDSPDDPASFNPYDKSG
jgi:hypothetical protein